VVFGFYVEEGTKKQHDFNLEPNFLGLQNLSPQFCI